VLKPRRVIWGLVSIRNWFLVLLVVALSIVLLLGVGSLVNVLYRDLQRRLREEQQMREEIGHR